jgi:preprotein translocase subunit SecE
MVGYRSPKPLIWVRILVPVQNNIMSSLVNFVKGSYLEFTQKVEWPKWDELRSSTIVVSVATIILAIFLFGVDEIFSKAIRNIIQILVNLFN